MGLGETLTLEAPPKRGEGDSPFIKGGGIQP